MPVISDHDDVAAALLKELAAFTATSSTPLSCTVCMWAEEPLPPASPANGTSPSADVGSPAQAACRN